MIKFSLTLSVQSNNKNNIISILLYDLVDGSGNVQTAVRKNNDWNYLKFTFYRVGFAITAVWCIARDILLFSKIF